MVRWRVVVLTVGFGLLLPQPSAAQCGPAMCSGMTLPTGGMSCSITFMNPTTMCPGYLQPGMCTNAMAGANAYNSFIMAWVGVAYHLPASPPTASCMWGGFSQMWIYAPPLSTYICAGGTTVQCSIVAPGDALPVELMEFSVEPEEDDS